MEAVISPTVVDLEKQYLLQNYARYPVVLQPIQPGRKIYPVKCTACTGKGKITDAN
jgi:hypothetical protein